RLLVPGDPVLRRNVRTDLDQSVEHDLVSIEGRSRGHRTRTRPLKQYRHPMTSPESFVLLHEIAGPHERCHVRVKVGVMHAHLLSVMDLRLQFRLDLWKLGLAYDVGLEQRQVALCIEQAWYAIARTDRSPAEARPLAVEREMDPKISGRMGSREFGDLR